MKVRFYIFLIFFPLFSSGQPVPENTDVSLFRELPSELFSDSKRVLFSPVKWSGKDWLIAGGSLAGIALAYTQDPEIHNWARSNQTNGMDRLSTYVGEPLGNPFYAAGGSLAIYVLGKTLKNDNLSEPALLVFKSVAITSGATMVFKLLTRRERPSEGDFPVSDNWNESSFFPHNMSFPSAHTATAFAVASSLSTYYNHRPWVGFVAYPLAGITAWSRVYDEDHWFSDVVAGAALGIFIGRTVARPEKYKWSVSPNNTGGWSLGFSCSF